MTIAAKTNGKADAIPRDLLASAATEDVAVRVAVSIRGLLPLLMHAPTTLDPFLPITREIAALAGKRGKSVDDQQQLARLEFEAGLYHEDGVPFIPASNVKEMLREAATHWRWGASLKRAMLVEPARIPLAYDGPTGVQELWDAGFRDLRDAGIGQRRVSRSRPRFEEWSLGFLLLIDTRELDLDKLARIALRAGRMIGLGDYRPEFGLFEIERLEVVGEGWAR